MRNPDPAVLDLLPHSAALVDGTGLILAVNEAWRRFGRENGMPPPYDGVGTSYLAVLDAARGEPDAQAVRVGLRAVLDGEAAEFRHEYACHAPGRRRWFLLDVVPVPPGGGALVLHIEVTTLKQREVDAAHWSRHDALTHLPNRRCFEDEAQRAFGGRAAATPPTAVLFVDLDGFKRVNDQNGHQAGDALLVEVGRRLQAAVRPTDLVARLGGDEFGVLLHGVTAEECARIQARLGRRIRAPYPYGDGALQVSASIGVAWFPDEGTTLPELLRLADRRMYARKERRPR